LWENCPEFIHRHQRAFRTPFKATEVTENKKEILFIHRVVADIVYKGI
jgi:hypothetical protein